MALIYQMLVSRAARAISTRGGTASPDGLVVTTHLCRGNNQSMWAAEGGYEFVAEALFGDLEDADLLRRRVDDAAPCGVADRPSARRPAGMKLGGEGS